MKIKFLLFIIYLLFAQSVFADEIVSRTTYSNSTVVLMCQNGNNINYCTEQDRQNAIMALRNPNISVVEEFKFKQAKTSNKFNQKCYNVQQKIGTSANLVNIFADTARMITSFIGIGW